MKKISVILLAFCAAGVLSSYETMGEAYKAGTTYRNNKDYKKALAAYEEAGKLAKNPQQKASAEFMSGIVICEDKQYEKGIARLRKALAAAQTDGQRVSCQFHIAYYLGIMRKYEEAIDEMRKVQEFGKEGIKHTYISRADGYIGNYLFALKRYEEAIDAVRDACRSEDNITAFMALNITYRSHKELKNNEGMMTAVDGLLNLNEPRPYMFFMSRQYAFERARAQKNHDLALKFADEIVSNMDLDPKHRAYGVYYKALSYNALHEKKKELAQWRLLKDCGVKYLESLSVSHIKRLQKRR